MSVCHISEYIALAILEVRRSGWTKEWCVSKEPGWEEARALRTTDFELGNLAQLISVSSINSQSCSMNSLGSLQIKIFKQQNQSIIRICIHFVCTYTQINK